MLVLEMSVPVLFISIIFQIKYMKMRRKRKMKMKESGCIYNANKMFFLSNVIE